MIAAFWHRLSEWASLVSCWLNVLRGGEREMTLSAESYWRSRWHPSPVERARAARTVAAIDRAALALTGEWDHCALAWLHWSDFVAQRLRAAGWHVSWKEEGDNGAA